MTSIQATTFQNGTGAYPVATPEPVAAALAGGISPSVTSAPAQTVNATAAVTNTATSTTAKPVSLDQVKAAAAKLNSFVSPYTTQINFSVDSSTGLHVVKVIDEDTKKVIRQFPSEEALAIADSIDKLQGLLVKQSV